MRTVFSDIHTIAHIFANNLQTEARTPSKNFSKQSGKLYSYSTIIAQHITNQKGESAVLISERRYSNTTSKQQSATFRACSHLNVITCEYAADTIGTDNFRAWLIEAEIIAAKLVNARKPENYINELNRLSKKVDKYANFLGLQVPAELSAALAIGSAAQYKTYSAEKAEAERKANEQREKAEAERKAKELAEYKRKLRDWKKGKNITFYRNLSQFDSLRLINDGAIVETTQGVKIGAAVARLFYNALAFGSINVSAKITDINGHSYSVTQVDKITVKIGCHTFKKSELLKFGATL